MNNTITVRCPRCDINIECTLQLGGKYKDVYYGVCSKCKAEVLGREKILRSILSPLAFFDDDEEQS